jgi:hypothetical protein
MDKKIGIVLLILILAFIFKTVYDNNYSYHPKFCYLVEEDAGNILKIV